MQDIFDMNIIDVTNRDREVINQNIMNMANNMLPAAKPSVEQSYNLIGVITKVNPDLTVDVFIPSSARTVKSVSFMQLGFGASSGLVLSPEEGMPCIVSKTKDKRWFAYGGITFKQGVSPRGLKEGEAEIYSSGTSIKAGISGILSVISEEVFMHTMGGTRSHSSESLGSSGNTLVISGSVDLGDRDVGYTRLVLFESAPVKGPFSLSESQDISNKATSVSIMLSELVNDISSASFDNDIDYVSSRLKSIREAISEPREPVLTLELGAAINSEVLSLSDLENIDSKYIIKDKGIPCVYRLCLFDGGEKTLDKRIFRNGEEVLI